MRWVLSWRLRQVFKGMRNDREYFLCWEISCTENSINRPSTKMFRKQGYHFKCWTYSSFVFFSAIEKLNVFVIDRILHLESLEQVISYIINFQSFLSQISNWQNDREASVCNTGVVYDKKFDTVSFCVHKLIYSSHKSFQSCCYGI